MRRIFVLVVLVFSIAAVVLLLSVPRAFSQKTNDPAVEFNNLVKKISTKLKAGKTHEVDFADNLKEFDALLVKYKGDKPEVLAQILLVKAQLYSDVFDEPQKTQELFKQIKRDFPTLQINGNTDEVINNLEYRVAKWKIRSLLAVGTKFPNFTTTDITGKPLSLAGYKGKVVLIDFWATFCPPCLADLPNMLKTYKKHHNQGFEIIGVSLDDNRQRLESFLKENGIIWRQSFDGQSWNGELVVKFGLDMLPSTFLLDGQGIIIDNNLRGEELERAVARALAKK